MTSPAQRVARAIANQRAVSRTIVTGTVLSVTTDARGNPIVWVDLGDGTAVPAIYGEMLPNPQPGDRARIQVEPGKLNALDRLPVGAPSVPPPDPDPDPPPPPGGVSAPTTFHEVYKCTGPEAQWTDLASTAHTPIDLDTGLTDWTGATSGTTGDATVNTNQTAMRLQMGVDLSSGADLTDCVMPYVGISGNNVNNTLKHCRIGSDGMVNYEAGTGWANFPGNPGQPYNGHDSTVKISCTGTSTTILENCEIWGGIDAVRCIGNGTIILRRCWLHDYLLLADDPKQRSGTSSVAHCDGVQINFASATNLPPGPTIIIEDCRFDWMIGSFWPATNNNLIGVPGHYNHTTGVLTQGTFWNVIDPRTVAGMSGQKTFSTAASAFINISPFHYLVNCAGVLKSGSSTLLNQVTINGLLLNSPVGAKAYLDLSINGGSALNSTATNVEITKPAPLDPPHTGAGDYIGKNGSGVVSTGFSSFSAVNQHGQTIAAGDR